MLKNAPTLAIVAVHTAENEPPKVYESPKKSLFKTRQVLEVRVLHVRRQRDVLQCDARFPGMVWQFACLVPCRVLRDDIFDQSFRIHLQDLPKRVLLYRHCTWESSASKNREEKDVYGGPHHCD